MAQVTTFFQKKGKAKEIGKNNWESNAILNILKLQLKEKMIDFNLIKSQTCNFFVATRGIPILKCKKRAHFIRKVVLPVAFSSFVTSQCLALQKLVLTVN